jgi:uncharacterized protein YndB with AHSA1/START domain
MIVTVDLATFSPQKAFDYFTRPELLTRWWPQEASVEPRAGGVYRMGWPAMNWELSGRYSIFEPAERLAFTWQWSHRPDLPARTVDVVFEPAGQGSRLTVTHGLYGDTDAEQDDRQSHIDGWIHFLSKLQAET